MSKVIKKKVKKRIIYLFAAFVFIVVAIILGVNYYNDYKYQQTFEYKLIEKGYTNEEANELENKLDETQMNDVLGKEKNDNVLKLLREKYYLSKNLDAYLEFYKEEIEKSSYDIVAMVNVHANLKWYEKEIAADTSLGHSLLVNKFYKLNNEFRPENLVTVSNWYCYGENKIVKEVNDAFVDMFNKAKDDSIKLIINSSYRNYTSQENTYNDIKNTYGTTKADYQAARPGHSEHETGLAFDIFTPGNTTTGNFEDSEAYKWLKLHASEFGFIERYPKDLEYITGYNFESWHWRYVGKEIAKKIVEEEITFDEYYAFYIEK